MVYPTDITYAGGKYRVHLVPEIRLALRAAWVSHAQRINYSFHRLSETQVQYLDGNFRATTRSGWYYRMTLFDEHNKFNKYLLIDQLLQCARKLETRLLRDYFITVIEILKRIL